MPLSEFKQSLQDSRRHEHKIKETTQCSHFPAHTHTQQNQAFLHATIIKNSTESCTERLRARSRVKNLDQEPNSDGTHTSLIRTTSCCFKSTLGVSWEMCSSTRVTLFPRPDSLTTIRPKKYPSLPKVSGWSSISGRFDGSVDPRTESWTDGKGVYKTISAHEAFEVENQRVRQSVLDMPCRQGR